MLLVVKVIDNTSEPLALPLAPRIEREEFSVTPEPFCPNRLVLKLSVTPLNVAESVFAGATDALFLQALIETMINNARSKVFFMI